MRGKVVFVWIDQADIFRYVEMLEQQQAQLVAGLEQTYRRLLAANMWPGAALQESNGHPLVHDILARLNVLESDQDGSNDVEIFEEDCEKPQQRLHAQCRLCVPGCESISANSGAQFDQNHRNESTRLASKRNSKLGYNTMLSLLATRDPEPVSVKQRNSTKPSSLHGVSSVQNDSYMESEVFSRIDTLGWQDPGSRPVAASMLCSDFGTALDGTLQSQLDNWHAFDSALQYDDGLMLASTSRSTLHTCPSQPAGVAEQR